MPKPTLHDRYVAALKCYGCTVVPEARTQKYTVMNRVGPGVKFYYVGSSGALRTGNTVGASIPVNGLFKRSLLRCLETSAHLPAVYFRAAVHSSYTSIK